VSCLEGVIRVEISGEEEAHLLGAGEERRER
jgi:hypothetical protein